MITITLKDRGYKMLFVYLKERQLIDKYIRNIQYKASFGTLQPYNYRPYSIKECLMLCVETYIGQHSPYGEGGKDIDFFTDLFNWAPGSFYWSESIEGARFWEKYFDDWKLYFDRVKEKYML